MLRAAKPSEFPWGDYRRYTFSLGLGDDLRLVLSGQTASSFDTQRRTMTMPDELEAQCAVIYEKIEAVLRAEGFTSRDIVEVTEHICSVAVSESAMLEAVRAQWLGGSAPAIRSVCVERLLRPDALIEIAVEAQRSTADPGRSMTPRWLTIAPKKSRGARRDRQASEVLDRAEQRLAELGKDWSNVAYAVEFVQWSEEGFEHSILDRADRIGTANIAGSRIAMRRLLQPGGSVQLDLRLSDTPVYTVDHRFDDSSEIPRAVAAATRTSGRVFLSGVSGPPSPDPEDIAGEAASAYRRLFEVLEAAGYGADRLVETIEYVTEAALPGYAATAAVRRALLPQPFSAATGTVCHSVGDSNNFLVYGTALVPS